METMEHGVDVYRQANMLVKYEDIFTFSNNILQIFATAKMLKYKFNYNNLIDQSYIDTKIHMDNYKKLLGYD